MQAAKQALLNMEAIQLQPDGSAKITALGFVLASLPVEPLMAKSIVLGSRDDFNCAGSLAIIACVMQTFDRHSLFEGPQEAQQETRQRFIDVFCSSHPIGDHETFLRVYEEWVLADRSAEWCALHSVNGKALILAEVLVKKMQKSLNRGTLQIGYPDYGQDRSDAIARVLYLAYFEQCAVMSDGGKMKAGFQLHPSRLEGLGDNVLHLVRPSSTSAPPHELDDVIIYHKVSISATGRRYLQCTSIVSEANLLLCGHLPWVQEQLVLIRQFTFTSILNWNLRELEAVEKQNAIDYEKKKKTSRHQARSSEHQFFHQLRSIIHNDADIASQGWMSECLIASEAFTLREKLNISSDERTLKDHSIYAELCQDFCRREARRQLTKRLESQSRIRKRSSVVEEGVHRFLAWFQKSAGRPAPPPRDVAKDRAYVSMEESRCRVDAAHSNRERCSKFVSNLEDLFRKMQRKMEHQQQKASRQEEMDEAWSIRSGIIENNNQCFQNKDFASMMQWPTSEYEYAFFRRHSERKEEFSLRAEERVAEFEVFLDAIIESYKMHGKDTFIYAGLVPSTTLDTFFSEAQAHTDVDVIPSQIVQFLEEKFTTESLHSFQDFLSALSEWCEEEDAESEEAKFLNKLDGMDVEESLDSVEMRENFYEHQAELEEGFETFLTNLSDHLEAAIEKRESKRR
jgi:hypothetical protein